MQKSDCTTFHYGHGMYTTRVCRRQGLFVVIFKSLRNLQQNISISNWMYSKI